MTPTNVDIMCSRYYRLVALEKEEAALEGRLEMIKAEKTRLLDLSPEELEALESSVIAPIAESKADEGARG